MIRLTRQQYAELNQGNVRAVPRPAVETPAARELRRAIAAEKRERLELMLLDQIKAARLPVPERNAKIKGTSKGYQFDFVWAGHKQRLVVECHGLLYGEGQRGDHQNPKGIERDTQKLCEAVTLGWRYLAVTRAQIESGKAIEWIERLLR